MQYKSPYLISNIHPNLIMLVLLDLLNTPLYENFGITIHPCQLDMFTLAMQTNTNVSCDIDESCDHNNEYIFEKEQE